jgi:hypothetical protein
VLSATLSSTAPSFCMNLWVIVASLSRSESKNVRPMRSATTVARGEYDAIEKQAGHLTAQTRCLS